MQLKHTTLFPRMILFLLLFVMIVQSCVPSTSNGINLIPTLTYAELDFAPCDQVTPVVPPKTKKPKVVYIFIDRSGSYGRYTKRAMDILIEGLKSSIDLGDRLYLIWLGANDDPNNRHLPQNPTLPDKYLLVETVPTLGYPSLTPPLPTFTSTITPNPTPASTFSPTPYATLGVLEAQAVVATVEAINAQLTVTADASNVIATNAAIHLENQLNKQECDQASINSQNLKNIENWEHQKKQIVERFVAEKFDPLRELYPQANDPSTHLYNSLYYAARTIRDEKNTGLFDSYYLIMLSDMEDAGSKEGEKLDIDLTDVNVLMAMVHCTPSIECQSKERYWGEYFKEHGARLPMNPFRLVEETTPFVISDFFRITGE